MSANLARTTTYIDKDILWMAKMKALKDNAGVYKVLNEWLKLGIKCADAPIAPKKYVKFDDIFKAKPLGIKGKLDRKQIYEDLMP